MDSRWLKGIPKDEEDARIRTIKSYTTAFNELRELLEKEVETSTPDYSSPSWSHLQADQNGANRKLRQILSIITLKD